jgi:mRNA interferase MazF
MPTFEQGDVVRVPFPYTDRNTRQNRPALVISGGQVGEGGALLWVAMITSTENRQWAGDVVIDDHGAAGLPAPSMVRPVKVATIEAAQASQLGRVDEATLGRVMEAVRQILT